MALVICGSNAISRNNEQKGAKVALMTLNLIGIPCQVWPWEDISHSTTDCVCVLCERVKGRGAYVSLSAVMWLQVCMSQSAFHEMSWWNVLQDLWPIDMCVSLFNRGLWIFKQHQLLHTATVMAPFSLLNPGKCIYPLSYDSVEKQERRYRKLASW